MNWKFEPVSAPCEGPLGGVVYDGSAVLFSAINENRILRFDPRQGSTSEHRRFTSRANGLALGPRGELYGCQEASRRVAEFLADGSATVTATTLQGKYHNHPSDLTVDRSGRIWFSDPHHPTPAFGPQLYPPLEHASVLRLARGANHRWAMQRMTFDTAEPRAVLLSRDQRTLFVSEGGVGRGARRELRAYPLLADDSLGPCIVLHRFGEDYRGPHRGIEGMCLDETGNILACAGWQRSGPGPLLYVFSPSGAILESHPLPDLPMRCAFGDAALDSLYVTTGEGRLYRARRINRRGPGARPPKGAAT